MSSCKEKLILTIFLLFLFGILKVQLHFIRLLLLLAFGVLGLWLLHRLAQDWNKITSSSSNRLTVNPLAARPVLSNLLGAASGGFRLSKRSIPNSKSKLFTRSMSKTELNRFNLRNVIRYDQLGCARKFVCYLAAVECLNNGCSSSGEYDVIRLIRSITADQSIDKFSYQLKSPLDFGTKYRNTTACNELFEYCPYTDIQLHEFYTGLK